MIQCPHPGIHVGDRCYLCIKQRALNGGRSKLSGDQLGFVGIGTEPPARHGWQPASNGHQDDSLEELRDIAPGWFELARRILESDGKPAK